MSDDDVEDCQPVDRSVAGSPPGDRRISPVVIGGGLLVGLVIGTILAWSLSPDPEPFAAPLVVPATSSTFPESEETAEAFLDAWERSRTAEYIAVSEWRRSIPDGPRVTEVRVLAQRLPDRVRGGASHRGGQIGHVVYTCDNLPITAEQLRAGELLDEPQCRAAEVDPSTVPDPETMVADELALMRRHVEGTYPLYRVGRDGDCFYLRLARPMVAPPYGHHAMFCFDPDSGAVSSLRVERDEGTDTEELLWVANEVTDDDLLDIIHGRFDPAASP